MNRQDEIRALEQRALEVAIEYRRSSVAFDPQGSIPNAACVALNALDDLGSRAVALQDPHWTKERTSLSATSYPDRFDWRLYLVGGKRYIDLEYATEAEADRVVATLNAMLP